MLKNKSLNRILILRVTLKILTAIAFIWFAYIFTSGFFDITETEEPELYTFNLSLIAEDSSVYYKTENRDILAIKHQGKFYIFWAYDPVYGCRLEYKNLIIRPVCIDIKYNLDGYNADKTQQLLAPDFKINSPDELIIY